MKIRVLVADPEVLLRELLVGQLRREPDLEVVAQAADGEQAVQLARSANPDVLVMKLLMPGLNGLQVAERISTTNQRVRSVLLTSVDGTEALAELGGHDCLHTHRSSVPDVVSAVRRAFAVRTAPEELLPEQRSAVAWMATRTGLTPRETQVLEYVVCSELTVGQVAKALSTETGDRVTEAAVRHAVARVMDKLKLEPRTRVALVKLVLEGGGGRRPIDQRDLTLPAASNVNHFLPTARMSCGAYR